jgi:nucleoside-diphosphate-sugar epimerase
MIPKLKSLKSVVFASSYLVYGSTKGEIHEASPIKPRNLIAHSKLYLEAEFTKVFPNTKHARIFRSYGYDSRDFISRLCRGDKMEIYGLTNAYDYIWAGDVARCLVDMMGISCGVTMNVGTGTATSIVDVVRMAGKNVEFGSRDIKLEQTWDATDLPNHVTVQEGIKRLCDYYSAQQAAK